MGNLNDLQDLLLSEIFSVSASEHFDHKGLDIYRNNLRATANRALSITFPTLAQLLGEQALSMVTEKLLQVSPPREGDWAVWGDALPEMLNDIGELSDYPFLADCARLDYHCHQIVRRPFVQTDAASLMLMQSHQPEDLVMVLNPTLLLLQSDFPIAQIRQAHLQPEPAFETLKRQMQTDAGPYYLACYLNGGQVQVSPLTAVEYAWLKALQTQSLGQALNDFHSTELSFETWLMEALHTNLLSEVQYQPPLRS